MPAAALSTFEISGDQNRVAFIHSHGGHTATPSLPEKREPVFVNYTCVLADSIIPGCKA